ncbi:MAG: HD domain-containing protein, partial [Vagococcus sp.]|nr:HD domain-containing protein [Vagococcus sp.]
RLFEGKDDTIEGELLAIADKVDLLYESFEEIVKNNPEPVYQEMFMESIQTIQQFRHRPSVSYFFKEIFPELLDKDFFGKEQFVNRVKQYVTLSEGN